MLCTPSLDLPGKHLMVKQIITLDDGGEFIALCTVVGLRIYPSSCAELTVFQLGNAVLWTP